MLVQSIVDLVILFGLGVSGWLLLKISRMPAAEIVGPVLIIGALRVFDVELPYSPDYLFPAIQVILGIFVGAKLTKDTLLELKSMASSALVVIIWSLLLVFIIGFFLDRYSVLDLYTAMLSASMGGMPEITVIALASGANVAVVIAMQLIRLVGAYIIFPIVLNLLESKEARESQNEIYRRKNDDSDLFEIKRKNKPTNKKLINKYNFFAISSLGQNLNRASIIKILDYFRVNWEKLLTSMAVASAGGVIFEYLGVPAGLMVGSTIFIAVVSVIGIPISKFSPRLLDIMLVFFGITIADNIEIETIMIMADTAFLIPIIIAATIMFTTSFGVALLIYRLTGWDYPTCFLAGSPAGLYGMTALAAKHNRDPFKISMLHLCRMLAVNTVIPFIFMYLMS